MSAAKQFYEEFNFEVFENENLSPAQERDKSGSEEKENVPSTKHIELWSEGDTKILLDKYYEFLNCVGPLKRFKNKKLMWMAIASKIGKTWKQCEQRYKTILRRKKSAVENNRTSGSSRVIMEYEDELRKIAAIDDSVEPEIEISSNNVLYKNVASSSSSSSSSTATERINRTKKKTVQETLLEIFEKKEAAKERRHREKIDKADKLQELLQKLIEKNQ